MELTAIRGQQDITEPSSYRQPRRLPSRARDLLVHLGNRFDWPSSTMLWSALSHLELGRWLCSHGLKPGVRVHGRNAVFDVALGLVEARGLLYLEFGVYRGDSLSYWAQHLPAPDAQLVGFDSFEGLPETWRPEMRRGHFSTNGIAPAFEDRRVRLVTGWFEDTLPAYEVPEHSTLVINIDADLYSSAHMVLRALEPHIAPGTLLYFDELNDHCNELRAFEEFLERTGRRFEVVATSHCWSHWLLRCLA